MLSIVFAHFCSSKEKEGEGRRKKASWKRRNQGMKLSHFSVRKNPNSSHVWDFFCWFELGFDFCFYLVLVMICELVYRCLRGNSVKISLDL